MTVKFSNIEFGSAIAAPVLGAMAGVADAVGGPFVLSAGNYKYKVTYYTDTGSTVASAATANIAANANDKIELTGIPVSSDIRVVSRKIYRTTAGGGYYWYLGTITNNTVTTYTDSTVSDAAIILNASTAPTVDYTMGSVIGPKLNFHSITGTTFRSTIVPSGGVDYPFNFDIENFYADPGRVKIFAVRNQGALLSYIDGYGAGYFDNGVIAGTGYFSSPSGYPLTLRSYLTEAGATTAIIMAASAGLTNPASKIVSFRNVAAEKASIDLNGKGTFNTSVKTYGHYEVSILTTPVNAAFEDIATGGSLLANTNYYYRVAAIDDHSSSLASTETTLKTANDASNTHCIKVKWAAITGATGYKIYGRTTGGELYIASVVGNATLEYTDTGAIAPAGGLPSAWLNRTFISSDCPDGQYPFVFQCKTPITGGRIFALQNATVGGDGASIFSIDSNGTPYCAGIVTENFIRSNVDTLWAYGWPTNGAAAIGVKLGSRTELVTPGAKIVSFVNGPWPLVEKASIDYLGNFTTDANITTTAGIINAGNYLQTSQRLYSATGNQLRYVSEKYDTATAIGHEFECDYPLLSKGADIVRWYYGNNGTTAVASLDYLGKLTTRGIQTSAVTLTALATPVAGATSQADVGGTLLNSTTYFYRVSAINQFGETLAFTEVSQATSGTGANAHTVTVTWTAVAEARTYKVYGRATGAETLIGITTALTFTDTNGLPAAWAGTTAYVVNDIRTNDTGKIYRCVVAGTSAGAGGPTGTGPSITDGTVTWDYQVAALPTRNSTGDFTIAGSSTGNDGSGKIFISATDSTGTPGNVIINKSCGKSAIANGTTSTHVTSSCMTSSSLIFITATVQGNATSWIVQNHDTYFTVYVNTNPGVSGFHFNWLIIN